MAESDDLSRDLGSVAVPAVGTLAETGDPWEPYCLTGPDGGRVEPVSEFLRDLQAAGRPSTTQRSYALALLRWFRFTWAVGIPWDQATRSEARDFCRYLQIADKPGRPRAAASVPGKRPAGAKYAPSTAAHCETVCAVSTLSPGGRDRADRQPVPAGQAGPGGCAPQPDGPVPPAAGGRYRPRVARRAAAADPGRGVQRACSPRCRRTGTGRWSRSGCRPGPGPRSCWAPGRALIRGSS